MPQINFGSGADGPLASLDFATKYETTSFPDDLAESPYFIVFRANQKYKLSSLSDTFVDTATGVTKVFGGSNNNFVNKVIGGVQKVGGFFKKLEDNGIDISIPSHSFALPIPTNLRTGYNAQYAAESLGPFGSIARDVASKVDSTGKSVYRSLKDAIADANLSTSDFSGALANMAMSAAESENAALIGILTGGVGGGLLAASAGNIAGGAFAGLRIARNPHLANVFTGVDFKTHTFTYKLIAKNKGESDAIRSMIQNFKYHMAPRYRAENHIFEYPSEFDIILKAGDYLFNFGTSVLQSFDVDYTGEGSPHFFEDTNAPFSVSITMTFRETTIVTKKEIQQGR